MKYTMYFAGLIACFFSIVAVQAQENKFLNSPARKLQLAEFAIANLYVDEVNEGKLVDPAMPVRLRYAFEKPPSMTITLPSHFTGLSAARGSARQLPAEGPHA